MSESATPESTPMSVEQAVAALTPEPVEQEAQEAPLEAAEGEETEGETSTPEDAEDGAENPAEGEEAQEEAEPVAAVEPPAYWSKDAKAIFAAMTPEQQAVVLAQEGPREEITAKVKAEAAAKIQQADAELGKVAQLAEALADRLPQWIEVFQSRWGDTVPNWLAIAEEHGVEAMTLAKTQYEAERLQLAEAARATEIADQQRREATTKAEFAKLAEIAPDLADPETGPAARQKVTTYLEQRGFTRAAIQQISAEEMSLAHDAMRWREAQAALKARPKPPTPAPVAKSLVRPAAAPAQPQQRSASQAVNRFAQTRSVDDAVAVLMAGKAVIR